MIADHQTNTVFVADTLEQRFPEVFRGLRTILEPHGIPLGIIPGTRDIWCRDYLPIQVAADRFVQFRYAPDYLTGKHRHLRADGEIGPTLPWAKNCVRSEIVLDGGNVVKWCDKIILTEKAFSENPRWDRRELVAELKRLLDVERIILIPSEPGDVTGHADGVVHFLNGGKVVVNDYRQIAPRYRAELLLKLEKSGLEIAEIPYRPGSGGLEGMPSAVGNYVNFLQVGSLIVAPAYLIPEDEQAGKRLALNYTCYHLTTLRCENLGTRGGSLACVTWPVILSADQEDTAGTCTSVDSTRRPK
jgi:agmatine deiminase